jgi:heptose-I-phosphate ethanolaminephosphotransferase
LRKPPTVKWYRLKFSNLAFIVILVSAIGGGLLQLFPKTLLVPQIVKVAYATTVELNHYNLAIAQNQLQKIADVAHPKGDGQTFVLIIGESCSRNHMSLYGSQLPTNPRLEKRTDLIAYHDVVSPHTYTTLSIPAILSNSNLENKIEFAASIDVMDVFHSAGFKTYWISNQSQIGIWDNVVSSIASKADYTTFVNTGSNSSQEAILSTSYDSRLFQPFRKVLEDDAEFKFIVLHLMGNHNTYSKRYPADFEVFKGANEREKLIAEYRNSVLYNDYVVDNLLNILKESSLKKDRMATAIYVSDHGENLYDEQERVGHDYARIIPKANVEIPFAVWMSESYISSYGSKAGIIRANTRKPFVSDDLFHCVLDINNIKIPIFEQRRSIFSTNFNERRERILADGYNYDTR